MKPTSHVPYPDEKASCCFKVVTVLFHVDERIFLLSSMSYDKSAVSDVPMLRELESREFSE